MSLVFAVITSIGIIYSLVVAVLEGYGTRSFSYGVKAFLAGLVGTAIGVGIVLLFLGLVTLLLSIFDHFFYSFV